MRKAASILFLLILAVSFQTCKKKGKKNPEACNGKIRREVKIMTDQLAAQVDTVPQDISLEDFGSLSVPKVKKDTERQDVEKKVYRVYAKVNKVDRERDGDFHIVLEFNDKYLIAEVVNPECDYAETSPFLPEYRKAREFVDGNDLKGKYVYVTGVAFVDIDHGPRKKQADNNLELHPVIDIHF